MPLSLTFMNSYFPELARLLLLPLTLLILCGALATVLLVASRVKQGTAGLENADAPAEWGLWHAGFLPRPERWLAVKSRKPAAVQAALGLHKARSCSWLEGLQGQKPFFIAPPLKGWIVVLGSGLPNPAEDVDECFRFVVGLSRKLGCVQFFSANRVVHHHAWVWAERGRVVRAYTWAGETLWTQGLSTPAETALGLRCFSYAEPPDCTSPRQSELVAANVDKVPLLAARWGLDPAQLGELLGQDQGIAGEDH